MRPRRQCDNCEMRSIALVALIMVAALASGCNIEADFSDSIDAVTLNPDEYRFEIAAIDRLLFTESPLGEAGVTALSEKLGALAARVGAGTESKFLKVESLELRLMAERAKRLSPTGNGARLQNDWMRIRNNLFDDRAWFARSAADLEYARSAIPLPEDEPAATATVETTVETARPTFEYDDRRDALEGAWQVVSVQTNGKASQDEELTAAIWTFHAPKLTMKSAGGNVATYSFALKRVDGRDYLRVSASGEDGWMLYELRDGDLRVAFFDGLRGRPTIFTPDATSDPLLVVVRLRAIR